MSSLIINSKHSYVATAVNHYLHLLLRMVQIIFELISWHVKKNKLNSGNQKSVRDFYLASNHAEIPKETKSIVIQACTEFCALDTRAFDLITGVGFQNLAKVIFDVGRKHYKSNMNMKELIPHPTTVNAARYFQKVNIIH